MFDKYRSLTQSSAFKHQRKPSSSTTHLFQPKLSHLKSLPTTAGSNSTCRKAGCLKRVLGIAEVL